jgi:hypothetical protein
MAGEYSELKRKLGEQTQFRNTWCVCRMARHLAGLFARMHDVRVYKYAYERVETRKYFISYHLNVLPVYHYQYCFTNYSDY